MSAPVPSALPRPCDLDAEAAVLSAVLLVRGALDEVAAVVRPGDFYADANRSIFEAALELDAESAPIDQVAVARRLRERGRLEGVGGVAYLAQVIDATPAVANAVEHAKRIAELAALRRLADVCGLIRSEALAASPGDVEAFMASAEARVWEATQLATAQAETLMTAEDAVRPLIAQLERSSEAEPPLPGVAVGLRGVDEAFGVTPYGEILTVAGRPGTGKTAFAIQMSRRCARLGEGVVFITAEQRIPQWTARAICQEEAIDSGRYRRGRLTPEERARFVRGAQHIARLPIVVDEAVMPTLAEVRRKTRRAVRLLWDRYKRRARLLVVDHFHRLNHGQQRGESETQAMGRTVLGLSALARELDVTLLLLAQLNRGAEDRRTKDARPRMSDLKGCGGLEENAFLGLLLYREEIANPSSGQRGLVEVIGGKVRDGGEVQTVNVGFNGPTLTFYDLKRPSDPEPPDQLDEFDGDFDRAF